MARQLLWLGAALLCAFGTRFLSAGVGETAARRGVGPGWAADAPGIRGTTMGTTWSLQLGEGVSSEQARALEAKVQERLDAIDARMSTWKPESELSRLNDEATTNPLPVSKELFRVLTTALEISTRTRGAFDPTVAPLVRAWGFGATDRIPAPPPSAELSALAESTGFEKVELAGGETNPTLRKHHPALTLDLSGVAKGYAVDEVAALMRAEGHTDFLAEVGGELVTSGRRTDGGAWEVGVERPPSQVGERLASGAPEGVFVRLALGGRALATSGDYRNFYVSGGRKYSHLIDPRTAAPVDHDLVSVSVAHERASVADALATALIVLGPEAGPELAEREGWAACFIRRSGDGFASSATPAFRELIVEGGGDFSGEGRP